VEAGIEYGLQLVGVPYGWWTGGPIPAGAPMWARDGPPPPPQAVSQCNCTGLTNLMLRAAGRQLPCGPSVGRGGTGAYALAYEQRAARFDPERCYARGTLLLRRYRGLADQGHVAVVLQASGPTARVLQSHVAAGYPEERPGVNNSFSVRESDAGGYYELAIAPEDWIAAAAAAAPCSDAAAVVDHDRAPSCSLLFVHNSGREKRDARVAAEEGEELHAVLRRALPALQLQDEGMLLKVVHRGKRLDLGQPLGVLGLQLGDGSTPKLMVISASAAAVASLATGRCDPTVRGFEEELTLEQSRRRVRSDDTPWGTTQHAEYKFCRFMPKPKEAYLHDSAAAHHFKADELLRKLAHDPAVIALMCEHKWTVGSLEEMDPTDDRLARQKEQEGGCLLGYNSNSGASIFLRMRTDDLKQFKPYRELVTTLLHELAHNVHGPHDARFWALFCELYTAYLCFHRAAAARGTLYRSRHTLELAGLHEADTQDVAATVLTELESQRPSPPPSPAERALIRAHVAGAVRGAAERQRLGGDGGATVAGAGVAAAAAAAKRAAADWYANDCDAWCSASAETAAVAAVAVAAQGGSSASSPPIRPAKVQATAATAQAWAYDSNNSRAESAAVMPTATEAEDAAAEHSTAPPAAATAPPPEIGAAITSALQVVLDFNPSEVVRSSLQTICSVLGNVVSQPHEAKFRQLNTAKSAVRARIVEPTGVVQLLERVGFREEVSAERGAAMLRLAENDTDVPLLAAVAEAARKLLLGR
jgi:hypothetical protein